MLTSNPILFARTARQCSPISARARFAQATAAELIFPMDREDWGALRDTYENRVRGRVASEIRLESDALQPDMTWEDGPYGPYAQFDRGNLTRFETDLSMYGRPAGTLCVWGKGLDQTFWMYGCMVTDNINGTGDWAVKLNWIGGGATGMTWTLRTPTGSRTGTVANADHSYLVWHLSTLDWGPLGIRLFYNDILVGGHADTGGTRPAPGSPAEFLNVNRQDAAVLKTGIGFLGFWNTQRGPDILRDLLRRRRYVA